MRLYLGTSGYYNDDWRGLLYPENSPRSAYLRLYAQHFNIVEVNSSFYGIPSVRSWQGKLRDSQGRLRFAVKLHQNMTHQRQAAASDYQQLRESVAPLLEQQALSALLAQFPYSFARNRSNRYYLQKLVQQLQGYPLALEFRNSSWDNDAVRRSVADMGLLWVSSDYPPLAGLPLAALHPSQRRAYLRFHGRNQQTWWKGKSAAERHDYRYSAEELQPWLEAIQAQAPALDEVYIVFANTTQGHALHNLAMLRDMMLAAGLKTPDTGLQQQLNAGKAFPEPCNG